MKKVNALMALCLIAACTFLAASCSKEGPTGPAGATGPAGPTGAAGTPGATGAKGDTGVANVIYSAWLDVPFTQDATTTNWIGTIAAPKIDANMLNKGEIKVYINFNYAATPTVVPLPYYDGNDIINVAFELQKITLISTYDFSSGSDATGKYYQYRYILIPGAKGARSAIDWNNYAEVKKYLNLQD
ncbi:MAG: collagen-like protein [Chitinophagaceae bacterium]